MRGAIIALILHVSIAHSQPKHVPLFVSNGVFVKDTAIAQVLDVWQRYLDSQPDSIYDNPYWNTAEKRRYRQFDLSSDLFYPNLYIAMSTYKPTVLSITSDGPYYKIRTLYSTVTEDTFADPLEIQDVYAKRDGNEFKLYNSLGVKTQSWEHQTIGSITFIYPPYHKCDRGLAVKMSSFADSLARLADTLPIQIDFYFANRLDELKRARGLDYVMGEGNAGGSEGQCWPEERIVFGAGANEWYPHEFVHAYFTKFHNSYFNEGVATMLGGSRGSSLGELIRHGDSLVRHNLGIRFDSLLLHPWQANLDYKTGADYLVGGLLVRMVYDKGGWTLVKQLSKYQWGPNELMRAMKDVFAVSENQYDGFIKEKIREYALKKQNEY